MKRGLTRCMVNSTVELQPKLLRFWTSAGRSGLPGCLPIPKRQLIPGFSSNYNLKDGGRCRDDLPCRSTVSLRPRVLVKLLAVISLVNFWVV